MRKVKSSTSEAESIYSLAWSLLGLPSRGLDPHHPLGSPRIETGERGLVSWAAARNAAKSQPPVSFVLPGTRLSRFRVHCFCCLLFSHPIRLAVPRAFSRPFLEVVKLRHVVYLQWTDIWRLFNFLTDRIKWTYALYIVAMFNNNKKKMTEKGINLLTTFRRVCLVNTLFKCKEE